MTNQLPNGWLTIEVGEIADVVSGGTPTASDSSNFAESGTDIAWLTPADLSGYKRKSISYGARDITRKGYNSSSAKLMPKGSILFSSRAPIGYVAISENEISTNQGFKSFIFSSGVSSDYSYYYFRSIKDIAESVSSGTTFKELSGSAAKKLPFILLPLAEQKEIATLLDNLLAQVDTLKTRLDAIPNILKRFRQSVLAAAVSGKLTEEWRNNSDFIWKQVSLADVALGFSYGTSSKSSKEGKTPVLRMGNIQNGNLIWDDLVYTSDTNEIKKYNLIKGDVLFNRTNSPELVGKTAIYRGEYPAIYAGYLICVRCKSALDPEFLNISLNSLYAKAYCRAVKSDGVSQSNINAKKLAAYSFYLPPIEEQTEIVRRVEELFAFADQIEQRVKVAQQRVNHLTQAILAKAFRGEFTAEWREQNPELISGENSAAALLARIQSERKKSAS